MEISIKKLTLKCAKGVFHLCLRIWGCVAVKIKSIIQLYAKINESVSNLEKLSQTLKQNLAFKQGLNPCLHKFDLLFFAFVWENGGNGW